jgi:hypothetical protein
MSGISHACLRWQTRLFRDSVIDLAGVGTRCTRPLARRKQKTLDIRGRRVL